MLFALCLSPFESRAAEDNQTSRLPNWPDIIQANAESLEKIESNESAVNLFVGGLGSAASLSDVASTLGAKGIPAQLAKELLIPEIRQSAGRLVAALAALRVSNRLIHQLNTPDNQPANTASISSMQATWLAANGPFPTLSGMVDQVNSLNNLQEDSPDRAGRLMVLAVSGGRLAQEAGQQAMEEWWRLKTWKDRVRLLRGQSRLCGTWQWVIHNHQKHHQEQKLSLLFPPPGIERPEIPGLAELVALGDTVYLRWEINGHTQEDSLLFSKEGNRLEGTFVNSQGGWGSISGKRTAGCTMK